MSAQSKTKPLSGDRRLLGILLMGGIAIVILLVILALSFGPQRATDLRTQLLESEGSTPPPGACFSGSPTSCSETNSEEECRSVAGGTPYFFYGLRRCDQIFAEVDPAGACNQTAGVFTASGEGVGPSCSIAQREAASSCLANLRQGFTCPAACTPYLYDHRTNSGTCAKPPPGSGGRFAVTSYCDGLLICKPYTRPLPGIGSVGQD